MCSVLIEIVIDFGDRSRQFWRVAVENLSLEKVFVLFWDENLSLGMPKK